MKNTANKFNVNAIKLVVLVVLGVVIFNLLTTLALASVSVSLSADRTSINKGDTVILNWNSNASYCRAAWTGNVNPSGTQTVTPDITTAYVIICTGNTETNSASLTISVNAVATSTTTTGGGSILYGLPSAVLAVNPVSLTTPGNVSLSWNSSNATNCFSSWTGSRETFGSQTIFVPQTTTYTISCTGPGGTNSASVNVIVGTGLVNTGAVANIGVGLVASSNKVSRGGAVTLYWATVNADRCSASWIANTASTGSQVVYPQETTNYVITCFRDMRSVSANRLVTVISKAVSAPAAHTELGTITLVASPNTIERGEFSILRWNSTKTNKCEAVNPDNWTVSTATEGEQAVNPEITTTYVIKCSGKNFSDFADVTLTVNPAKDKDEDKEGLAAFIGDLNLTRLFFAFVVFVAVLIVALVLLRKRLPQG